MRIVMDNARTDLDTTDEGEVSLSTLDELQLALVSGGSGDVSWT